MSVNTLTRTQTLSALHAVTTELQASVGTPGLAQSFLDLLEDNVGYDYLAVLLVNERHLPEPVALSRQNQGEEFLGQDTEYVRRRMREGAPGIATQVAASGESISIPDVRLDNRYLGIRDDIRSELCVPIKANGKVLGVINTETLHLNEYRPADTLFLETAANYLGLALTTRASVHAAAHLETMCSYCKKMRVEEDGHDRWIPPEAMFARMDVAVSHGICSDCLESVEDFL